MLLQIRPHENSGGNIDPQANGAEDKNTDDADPCSSDEGGLGVGCGCSIFVMINIIVALFDEWGSGVELGEGDADGEN